MFLLPPWIPLCLTGVIRMVRPRRSSSNNKNDNTTRLPFHVEWLQEFGISIFLWLLLWPYPILLKSSILPWWGPLNRLVSLWPYLLPKAPAMIRHGGPLGTGCGKVTEVITAIFLWKILHQTWPPLIPDVFGTTITTTTTTTTWIGLACLCVGVNVVLNLWSTSLNSRGDHSGVNDMVSSTQGRSLQFKEQISILGLAFINGTVEEITSRFFWMTEFQNSFTASSSSSSSNYFPPPHHCANLAQAVIFGLWHYHGIPSGWIGVGLTFGYGIIMGFLYQYYQGLVLPIIAHTIADYYIFAFIARRKLQSQTKKHNDD